ncbi:hypothetical protein CU039_2368 [Enterococcus faecium]|nr:hypothetical protein [Enterococcus faecium]
MEKVCQVTIVHKEKVNVIKKKIGSKRFFKLTCVREMFQRFF